MIAICYAVEMACCGEQVVDFVVGFRSEFEVFYKSRVFSVCEGHASEASDGPCTITNRLRPKTTTTFYISCKCLMTQNNQFTSSFNYPYSLVFG